MSDISKVKALIVDDETHIRELMKAVLNSMNVEVAGEASNGDEAINAFKDKHPNLILMDVNMPICDGVTALKAIKEESDDVLVIMLTSITDMNTIQECIDAGAGGYLRKDTPIDELRTGIKEAWRNK